MSKQLKQDRKDSPPKLPEVKKFDMGPEKKKSTQEIAFMLAPPLQGYKRKNSFSRASETNVSSKVDKKQ
jgi:hypothetical protein